MSRPLATALSGLLLGLALAAVPAPARAASSSAPAVRTVCVVGSGNARMAIFDVSVRGPRAVTIRRGKHNRVSGGSVVGPLPTRFGPGTTRGALRIRFAAAAVTWKLGRSAVRVAAADVGCAAAGARPATSTPVTAPAASRPLAAPATPVLAPEPPASPAPSPVVTPAPAPVPRQIFGAATFWNAQLAPTATLAGSALNPAAGQELQADSLKPNGSSNTRLNARSNAAPITSVGATTALQPVRLCVSYPGACVPASALTVAAMLQTGVAIPDSFTAPVDAEGLAVFLQQDWVGSGGERDRAWELRGLRRNPDYDATRPASGANAVWMAAGGGLLTGVGEQGGGRYGDSAGGVLGSGLPLLGTEIRAAECSAGTISHAIGLSVPDARDGAVWPATRSNGVPGASSVLQLGMRLRLQPGAVKPAGLTRFGSALWDAAARYGFVIDDRTGTTLNVRAEPACATGTLWNGVGTTAQLRSFPWADLRVLAEGSDATPTR